MVEVQVHPQVRAVDGRDEGAGVGGPGERRARVVDGGVEVLQAEDDVLALAQRRRSGAASARAASHIAPVTDVDRLHGQPVGRRDRCRAG